MKKRRLFQRSAGIPLLLIAVCVLVIFGLALTNLDSGRQEESKLQLEQAIRRSAVACYAAEGVYPPSLDYLQEYYGLQIDYSKYHVVYEIFAENLMPDITVLDK